LSELIRSASPWFPGKKSYSYSAYSSLSYQIRKNCTLLPAACESALNLPQVNIVAFATDNSVPVGSVEVTGPWVEPVPQQELLDKFEGWGHDVMAMLKHLNNPSKWSIHTLTPLETFVRGKIVLVGDAVCDLVPLP
jgi:hypothetical protein